MSAVARRPAALVLAQLLAVGFAALLALLPACVNAPPSGQVTGPGAASGGDEPGGEAVAGGAAGAPAPGLAPRPNLLLIVADDLGWGDLGCYGGELATPRIDGLAAQGVRFTDFNTTASVCTPSRYSLLTGRLPERSLGGLGSVGMMYDPAHRAHRLTGAEPTLAALLREAGYRTALFGKWAPGAPPPRSSATTTTASTTCATTPTSTRTTAARSTSKAPTPPPSAATNAPPRATTTTRSCTAWTWRQFGVRHRLFPPLPSRTAHPRMKRRPSLPRLSRPLIPFPLTSMRSPLILLLILAVVATTAFLVWSGGPEGRPPAPEIQSHRPAEIGDPEEGAEAAGAAPQLLAPANAPAVDVAIQGREVLPSTPAEAIPVELVLTVRHLDGSPAPDFPVFLFSMSPERLEQAQQLSHEQRRRDSPAMQALMDERRTDSSGVLRWQHDGYGLGIQAWSEGFRGSTGWKPDGGRDLELTLHPLRSLAVRVLDEGGRPVGGVPVQWSFSSPERRLSPSPEGGTSRPVDGLAPIPSFPWTNRNGAPATRGFVVAEILAPEWPAVEVPADPWPTEPVDLTVPPFGGVEILTPGFPEDARMSVELRIKTGDDRLSRFRAPRLSRSGFAGELRFPQVGLGLQLEATMRVEGTAGSFTATGPGPLVSGETVALALDQGGTPVLVGRLLREDGQPAEDEDWKATLLSEGMRSRTTLKVDEEGRFRYSMGEKQRSGDLKAFVIEPRDPGWGQPGDAEGPLIEARVELPPLLPPGVTELGDLRFQPLPFLYSGRVIDGQGEPVAGARVGAEYLVSPGGDREFWVGLNHSRDPRPSSADGSFEVRGSFDGDPRETMENPRFRLTARAEGYVLPEAIPFVIGEEGIEVVMARGGELHMSFLLPDGLETARDLSFHLNPAAGGAPLRMSVGRAELTEVIWRSLPAGRYDFEVRHDCAEEPLMVVPGIVVQGGAAARPEALNPCDLKPMLGVASLMVLGKDGHPVEKTPMITWQHPSGRGGGGGQQRRADGSYLVPYFKPAPCDLMVGEFRGRSVLIPAFQSDQVVELGDPIEVEVRLPRLVTELDPGRSLEFRIQRHRTDGSRVPFSQPEFRGDFRGDPTATLVFPAPGIYRWKWAVLEKKDQTWTMVIAEYPGGEWRIDEASHGTTIELEPPAELGAVEAEDE